MNDILTGRHYNLLRATQTIRAQNHIYNTWRFNRADSSAANWAKLNAQLTSALIELIYVPTELRWYEVTVRAVCGRILVHAADDAFLA